MGKVIPVLLLLLGYTTLPIIIWFLSGFHYYYDFFVVKIIETEIEREVFDFIIEIQNSPYFDEYITALYPHTTPNGLLTIIGYRGTRIPYLTLFGLFLVGGGSAGSVLANRLSRNNRVLLLEAGGDPFYWNRIPGLSAELIHQPQISWSHQTVPQEYSCWGLVNNSSRWISGKLLGGSSSLNYMLYVHGHQLDYDNWANLTGDPSWNYENVRHFFRGRSKSAEIDSCDKGQTHSSSFHIEENKWRPMYELFMDAGRELGYEVKNFNYHQTSGFGHFDLTQKEGNRHGAFEAYLQELDHRSNLRISRYSQVSKIKLDKFNRAKGVWFIRHGKREFGRASKEVILSAGAVNSPKLLMLSGIGPKSHLESLGIKVKADLPVGKNLQDHIMTMMFNIVMDEPLSMIPERDFDLSVQIEYFLHGRGPLTTATGAQGQAFISTEDVQKTGVDWPDIQLYLFGVGNYEMLHSDFSRQLNLRPEILQNFTKAAQGTDGFILAPALVRPKSVGEILLRDKDPMSPPIIDPLYLQHPQDIRALIEGIKFSLKIVEETKTFQRLNARLLPIPLPGCEDQEFRSDKYWECYIRHLTMTLYHPSGTCRMGRGEFDPKAVLDSNLRVLKTVGLRVVDTSVMVDIVNGNTNAAAMMIGEKAAFMIREYWSEQYLVCPTIYYPLFDTRGDFSRKCHYSKLV